MKQKKWWQEEIIYQIYPKSFKDSNGDGIGDLPGICEKLPYLHQLGITMIWLCPIFPSPMHDNGYDISDYQAIHPKFGTMEDFDRLIAEAKSYGIKIVIDLVVNHTSDQHYWFQQALANPKSPYRNYYIFRQAEEGKQPNNWRSIFGGSVWQPVPNEPNNFYFHSFGVHQPDLNWENPILREEIYQMVNWWLERGITGFRVDAITFIKKDQDYQSLPPDGKDGLASVKHKGRNRKGIEQFLAELNECTFSRYPCVTVGEAPGVSYAEYDQFIGEKGYFDMVFDFSYADIDVKSGSEWFRENDWTAKEFKQKLFVSQQAIQAVGWGANFLENHDQPRSLSKYIKNPQYQNAFSAKGLAMLLLCLRGTPFIYQGQELAMKNFQRTSLAQFNDISSFDNYQRAILEGLTKQQALAVLNKRSRDNSRTPFQWDLSPQAGFTTASQPWLDFAEDPIETSAKQQIKDPDSVFHFYRQLIALRRHSPYQAVLSYGDFAPLNTADNVIGYQRIHSQGELQLYFNLSEKEESLTVPKSQVILSNQADLTGQAIQGNLRLSPYQAILLSIEEK